MLQKWNIIHFCIKPVDGSGNVIVDGVPRRPEYIFSNYKLVPLVDLVGLINEDNEKEPFVPVNENEEHLQAFFEEADYFEIAFYFHENMLERFPDPYERAKVVEIIRETIADNGTYVDVVDELYEQGIIDSAFKKTGFWIFDTTVSTYKYHDWSIMVMEYDNYSNGTSLEIMLNESYEVWSERTKLATMFWAFGAVDSYSYYCRNEYLYEPKYELTAPKETGNNTKSIEDIISESSPGRATKGPTTQYMKQGGYNETLDDFNALKPTDTKDINTNWGTGKTGTLPDGSHVTARPGSSQGSPTLEIRNPTNGRGIEIRYGE